MQRLSILNICADIKVLILNLSGKTLRFEPGFRKEISVKFLQIAIYTCDINSHTLIFAQS